MDEQVVVSMKRTRAVVVLSVEGRLRLADEQLWQALSVASAIPRLAVLLDLVRATVSMKGTFAERLAAFAKRLAQDGRRFVVLFARNADRVRARFMLLVPTASVLGGAASPSTEPSRPAA